MDENILEIVSVDQIKVSANNRNYRHVLLKDPSNNKTIDFIIFEKDYPFVWESINKNELETAYLPGKIVTIRLTKDLVNRANINNIPVNFNENQLFEIVIWNWSEWSRISETVKLEWSLKEQLWKMKNY